MGKETRDEGRKKRKENGFFKTKSWRKTQKKSFYKWEEEEELEGAGRDERERGPKK